MQATTKTFIEIDHVDESKLSSLLQSQECDTTYVNDNSIAKTNPLLQSYVFDKEEEEEEDFSWEVSEEDESEEDNSFDADQIAKEDIYWENYEPYDWDEWSDEEDCYDNDDNEQM